MPDRKDGAVTATETVVAACALIRAADLNLFDVAMWFHRAPRTTATSGSGSLSAVAIGSWESVCHPAGSAPSRASRTRPVARASLRARSSLGSTNSDACPVPAGSSLLMPTPRSREVE